jgi:CBS domain-containing protein
VSGPTKCGKTVLLKSVLTDAIWLSGGSVPNADAFWTTLGDWLGVFTDEQQSSGTHESNTITGQGEVGGSFFGLGAKAGGQVAHGATLDSGKSVTRRRPVWLLAKLALVRAKPIVVIDDFHYIPQSAQLEIVRNIKELVFDGVPFILASVPHRAYDAVRVEKEMTGRVEQLQIDFWSHDELLGIAQEGFRALNVVDDDGLADRLGHESFHSPHLMQDFCLQLSRTNHVARTEAVSRTLLAPDWKPFFSDRASNASKAAFDLLARGPRQRTDRIPRRLTNGKVTDIYGAVLAGIAHTGPLTELTYEELRTALRTIIAEEPPQRHEVTRVLEEMTKIARTEIEGEPVVDYDQELGKLFISDPFFAFYLRWGVRD